MLFTPAKYPCLAAPSLTCAPVVPSLGAGAAAADPPSVEDQEAAEELEGVAEEEAAAPDVQAELEVVFDETRVYNLRSRSSLKPKVLPLLCVPPSV